MNEIRENKQVILDSSQYEETSILQYESIYGEDFVSPGGRALAYEMIARLALEPGAPVLDVGCGLGGSAFLMASEFGLRVDALDLSRNMLRLAQAKLEARGLAQQVNLQWGDCLELDCEACYTAIYSRDVFLHIEDKSRLFERLRRALQSGGQLLFTDYCCGDADWSDDFSRYVEDRGYTLHTPRAYADLMAAAGFRQVVASDETARFIDILQTELSRIETLPFSSEVRSRLQDSWQQKIRRAKKGEQRWGLFSAVK